MDQTNKKNTYGFYSKENKLIEVIIVVIFPINLFDKLLRFLKVFLNFILL